MAVYAIYSYELQEGSRSLFYRDTGIKAIDMANEIVGNLLHDGLTVVGKKTERRPTFEESQAYGARECVYMGVVQCEGHYQI